MYKVEWIKKQKIIGLIVGVGTFLLMLLCDSFASMCRNSVQYYWSSDVREGASLLSGVSLFLGLLSAFMFATSIFMFYLDKNGKVCSECQLVYLKSSARCFKCKNDITYAKSIAEYRAESLVAKISYSDIRNNAPDVSREKFCSFCGQKMRGTDHFCPSCGKKN